MTSSAPPPSFSSDVNLIKLDSTTDSKIINVNLYSGRAEITRLYKFKASTGANKIEISSLPDAMYNESVRIEGRGAGIIHDVSVFFVPPPQTPTTSDLLSGLIAKKVEIESSIERCKKCLGGLSTYLDTLSVSNVDVSQLSVIVENYEATTAKFDNRVSALQQELSKVENDITLEKNSLKGFVHGNSKLRKAATIGFFADNAGDFEICVIYSVTSASWYATYDVRVSTQSKEAQVQVFYKAEIAQSTGESWDDVPLTLETVTPTSNVVFPTMHPWKLSIYKPPVPKAVLGRATMVASRDRLSMLRWKKEKGKEEAGGDSSDDDMGFGLFDGGPAISHSFAKVTSKGDLNATFLIPGQIIVPSDGAKHTFTIRNLDLTAKLSWIVIPKFDTRTRLTAKINNNSEYTFIPGKGNIYVDGSFVSSTNVPLVSPGETFTCPLGIDQSIRILYHPRETKASKSGFYSKTNNTTYSQRITVQNTKATAVNELIIVDQIPVSEDSQISINLRSPQLALPESTATLALGDKKSPPIANVEVGVTAHWLDTSDTEDSDSLGKDGKLKWVCSVASQKKLNLVLSWEVVSPVKELIVEMNDA